jgi:hypothetical protein
MDLAAYSLSAGNRNPIHTELLADSYRDAFMLDATNLLERAYQTDINLTPEQHLVLNGYFSPRVVQTNRRACNSHPIAAVLREFGYRDLENRIQHSRPPRIIDVGGSPKHLSRIGAHNRHICTKPRDSRDEYRLREQLRQIAHHDIAPGADPQFHRSFTSMARKFLSTKTEKEIERFSHRFFCTLGAENCTIQAEYAMSVDALYDIKPKQVGAIFETHGLYSMDAWMLLPYQLISDEHMLIADPFMLLRTEGENIVCSFHADASFSYSHKKKTWRSWLTTTLIQCDGFNVAIEVKDSVGPYRRLHFERVVYCTAPVRTIDTSSITSDWVTIPDVHQLVATKYSIPHAKLRRMVVRGSFARQVFNYAVQREDAQFSFSAIFGYARGICTNVVIAKRVVHTGYDCSAGDFNRIVTCLIIMAAACRVKRTKIVASAFNELKEEAKNIFPTEPWIVGRAICYLRYMWYNKVGRNVLVDIKADKRNAQNWSTRLMDCTLDDFEPFDFDGTCTTKTVTSKKRKCFLRNLVSARVLAAELPADCVDSECARGQADLDALDAAENTADASSQAGTSDTTITESSNLGTVSTAIVPCYIPTSPPSTSTPPARPSSGANRQTPISSIRNAFLGVFKKTQLTVIPPTAEPQTHFAVQQYVNDTQSEVYQEEPFLHKKTSSEPTATAVRPVRAEIRYYPLNYKRTDWNDVDSNTTTLGCGCKDVASCLKCREEYCTSHYDAHCPHNLIGACSETIHGLSQSYTAMQTMYNSTQRLEPILARSGSCQQLNVSKLAPTNSYEELVNLFHVEGAIPSNAVAELVADYARFEAAITEPKIEQAILSPTASKAPSSKARKRADRKKVVAVRRARPEPGPTLPLFSIPVSRIDAEGHCSARNLKQEYSDETKRVAQSVHSSASSGCVCGVTETCNFCYGVYCNVHYSEKCPHKRRGVIELARIADNAECMGYCATTSKSIPNLLHLFSERYFHQLSAADVNLFKMEVKRSLAADPEALYLRKLDLELEDVELTRIAHIQAYTLFGVPGCGKTRAIKEVLKTCADLQYLVITPTRNLQSQYVQCGIHAMTFHKGMTELVMRKKVDRYRVVIIDEAPLLPLSYWAIAQMHCEFLMVAGDPKQITHVDFSDNHMYSGYSKIDPDRCTYSMNTTKRCPQDITVALARTGYRGITTTSKVQSSIKHVTYMQAAALYSNLQWLTFTQKAKARIAKVSTRCNTVHEIQGQTYERCVLYVTRDATVLYDRLEHVRVAISRHTEELIVVDEQKLLVRHLGFEGTAAQAALDRAGVVSIDIINHQVEDCATVDTPADSVPNPGDRRDAPAAIEDVLANFVVPASRQGDAIDAIERRGNIKMGDRSQVKVMVDRLTEETKAAPGRRLRGTNIYGRYYTVKSPMQTVRTALIRYGKDTKHLEPDLKAKCARMLKQGFKKFVNMDKFEYSYDRVQYHAAEALKAAIARRKLDFDKDFLAEYYGRFQSMFEIAFHQKNQSKLDFELNALSKDKAGQGISAWCKALNIYVAAYVRTIHEEVERRCKAHVVVANGEPESVYSDAYKLALQSCDIPFKDLDFVANDFTEFDSSQNAASIAFDCSLMELGGAPPFVVEIYSAQRSHWTLTTPRVMKLAGELKKHSGEPGTLTFNTTYNMAVMGQLVDFDKLVFAGFKGDDSVIVCKGARKSTIYEEFLKEMGLKVKFDIPKVAEFIGYVLTDRGFFPDVIRRVCKFHTQRFRSTEHLVLSAQSLSAGVAHIRNNADVNSGLKTLCHYYLGFTNEQYEAGVRMLYEYCLTAATNKLFMLDDYNRDPLPVYADEPEP